MKKILLVEPSFPIPPKSKNHKNFLPIGLLKIASYLENQGLQVRLMRGTPETIEEIANITSFDPDEVWITSLFTYWAKYVRNAVKYYKTGFPKAKVKVGGIYASLLPKDEVKRYTGCDVVYQGVMEEAENFPPAYNLLEDVNPHPIDYQIIHASRGCERRCSFCGTWKIETKFISEKSIKDRIEYKKIVFYDNNLLKNKFIEDILEELTELKKERKIIWCESQSGFDGRILLEKPYLAKMIKQAGFRYPRIAWDWGHKNHKKIKKQLKLLSDVGYISKDMYVFVLYNWDIPFEEMERKRKKCFEWKVQIADCRYRPLDQIFDNYKPHAWKKGQTSSDYYIHEKAGWTDTLIRQFRKNIRRQNICVRQGLLLYVPDFEHKIFPKNVVNELRTLKTAKEQKEYLKKYGIKYWDPSRKASPWKSKLR